MTTEPPILYPPPAANPSSPIVAEPMVPRAWGFWLTIAFSICIFVCYVIPQVAVAIIAAGLNGSLGNPRSVEAFAMNGLVVGIGICIATPVAVGLCILFAWLRRTMQVSKYLAWIRVSWRTYVVGVVAIVLFNIIFALVGMALDRPEISETMLNVYRTAGFAPILWTAMVLGAPLVEEVFFRGFLFMGMEQSPVGGFGAVLLTSLAWAAIHLQYDLYDMGVIFAMGLLLGAFRWKTGSLRPALLMHVLNNLAATIAVSVMLNEPDALSALP